MLNHHSDMTSYSFRETAEGSNKIPLYILPLGNEEAHGPCLPLGTDTFLARAFAEICRQAAATIENVSPVVLPALNYGYSPTTANFPGTVTIGPRILADMLKSIAGSVMQGDKAKLSVISIHGENEVVVTLASHEFFDETGKQILFINPYKKFAGELDPDCFEGKDNSTKEISLLLAGLSILNEDELNLESFTNDLPFVVVDELFSHHLSEPDLSLVDNNCFSIDKLD